MKEMDPKEKFQLEDRSWRLNLVLGLAASLVAVAMLCDCAVKLWGHR